MKLRGFEVAKGWEDQGISLPRRSTAHSAGYDLMAATDITVPAFCPGIKPTLIPTGLKVYCPTNECLLLFNRSSGAGKGIVLANGVGVVDADFYENPTNDGHFQILVFNLLDHPLQIKKGDRIAQAVFHQFLTADSDMTTSVRQGGIGSTDRTTPLRIVYDLDDVLWELTHFVMDKLQLSSKVQTNFRIQDDPGFTAAEKSRIVAAYSDAANFETIKFYPGASEILAVMAPDVEVSINSNAYSAAIVEVKRRRLREFYPTMPEHLQQINLVSPTSNRKTIGEDVLVFVDDSPYNIAHPQAKFNLMPQKSWNNHAAARQIAKGAQKIYAKTWKDSLPEFLTTGQKYVIPVEDLSAANQFIQQVVKLIKGDVKYDQK